VGVWVGNFDGEPMHNVSGITGSGPLFRDIMIFLHKNEAGREFPKPDGLSTAMVCPFSGRIPTAFCPGAVEEIFIEGTEPRQVCPYHRAIAELPAGSAGMESGLDFSAFRILFPHSGDVFKIDPILRKAHQRIKLKVDVFQKPWINKVEWWINGERAGESGSPFTFFWNLRPGSYTIKAVAVGAGSRLESRPVKITVLA
jgi:penicillin-binding protein 1C